MEALKFRETGCSGFDAQEGGTSPAKEGKYPLLPLYHPSEIEKMLGQKIPLYHPPEIEKMLD